MTASSPNARTRIYRILHSSYTLNGIRKYYTQILYAGYYSQNLRTILMDIVILDITSNLLIMIYQLIVSII